LALRDKINQNYATTTETEQPDSAATESVSGRITPSVESQSPRVSRSPGLQKSPSNSSQISPLLSLVSLKTRNTCTGLALRTSLPVTEVSPRVKRSPKRLRKQLRNEQPPQDLPRVFLEIEMIGVTMANPVRVPNRDVYEFYEFGEQDVIGKGAFGDVYKAVDKETGEVVAIKAIQIDNGLKNHLKKIKRELMIIKFLHHENIVRFFEYFKTEEKVFLVMELAEGGELLQLILDNGFVAPSDTAGYMRQILAGIDYMHQHGIVHRDLTLENLLVDKTKTIIKITDFGVSKNFRNLKKGMKRFVGNLPYLAPEFLDCKIYDQTVDIWAIGVIAYFLLAGYPPFDGRDDNAIWARILKLDYRFYSPEWDDTPQEAKDFITKILVKEPSHRPTTKDLLNHPWIQSHLPQDFVSPKRNPKDGLLLRLGANSMKMRQNAGKYRVPVT